MKARTRATKLWESIKNILDAADIGPRAMGRIDSVDNDALDKIEAALIAATKSRQG
ncbi:MAG: hypothetical protein HXX10_07470 [Rhodoplanes sp.]|uniref:hypothetical protein n=1 Tax=Rhodoplanes sp. TaxID=1968906 RepID=UPI0017DE8107|nr:hypothetical protein [Rhodoplanes sp.]NVO13859.1 hypothetical protein [Rhodoplanes sp.]